MKKILIFYFLALPMLALAEPASFTVSGTIQGLKDQTIYLRYGKTTDSLKSATGEFTFKGQIEDITTAYLRVGKTQTSFFLEKNAVLKFTGDLQELENASVSGSKMNDDLSKYTASVAALNNQRRPVMATLMEAYQKKQPYKEYSDQVEKIDEQIAVKAKEFVQTNPESAVSAWLVRSKFFYGEDSELATMYGYLKGEALTSTYAKDLKKKIDINAKTGVGQIAMDFTQNDVNEKPVSLSSLRGKYVLVDFWASWCGPCRQENPNIVKAYNQYKDKGFTVLGVSLDQKKEPWLKAIEKDQLTWTHVSDLKYWQNEVAVQYGINSIPASYLLDSNGKIIGKNLRGEALTKKLAELMPDKEIK
ncbi:MAG: TlpA disulfide reductase family protein [Spirosomataceae bacterium]